MHRNKILILISLIITYITAGVYGLASFVDVSGWEKPYVDDFLSKKVITDDSGYFNGADNLSRAEAAKIILEYTDKAPIKVIEGARYFSDVDPDSWQTYYLVWAKHEGLMSGNDNKMMPNTPVSRAEYIKMAVESVEDLNFNGEDWVTQYVTFAYKKGVFSSNNFDNIFQPITRREALKVLYTLVNGKLEESNEVPTTPTIVPIPTPIPVVEDNIEPLKSAAPKLELKPSSSIMTKETLDMQLANIDTRITTYTEQIAAASNNPQQDNYVSTLNNLVGNLKEVKNNIINKYNAQ